MVLYSKCTDGSQFPGEKTVCNSIVWFTSYNNFNDTGEFGRFLKHPVLPQTFEPLLDFKRSWYLEIYLAQNCFRDDNCHLDKNYPNRKGLNVVGVMWRKVLGFKVNYLALNKYAYQILAFY